MRAGNHGRYFVVLLFGERTKSRPQRFKEAALAREKKRKKTDNPREGWEDGTPPPHRDFKERSVMR